MGIQAITDENDLEKVRGGLAQTSSDTQNADSTLDEQLRRITCPHCSDIIKVDATKSVVTCPTCHKPIEIKG